MTHDSDARARPHAWYATLHMTRGARRVAPVLAGAALLAACASAPARTASNQPASGGAAGTTSNEAMPGGAANTSPTPAVRSAAGSGLTPAEMARRDGGRPPYTRADVEFMTGMIGHHAQAVTMARWAPTHGANASLQILAERIAIAQEDEIAFMRTWLGERGETVHMHHAHMPGMLTADELAQLDKARGAEFDRLFLTFMIRHHEGALVMVDKLLSSPGAAQDDEVYRFVADVNVDQDTEIARMTQMLEAMRASP